PLPTARLGRDRVDAGRRRRRDRGGDRADAADRHPDDAPGGAAGRMSTGETQIFVSRSPGARSAATVLAWIGAAALGLGIGVLTSFGQGWLTGTSNAFVNSESAWL